MRSDMEEMDLAPKSSRSYSTGFFLVGIFEKHCLCRENPGFASPEKQNVCIVHCTSNEIKYSLYVCRAITITHTETY
jgi:hypothetical protein